MNVATYQFDLRTGRRRATAGAPPHARVTLRGIVVENIWAAPRLFSWTCVARIPGESEPLILYEEDGSHARAPDGRPPRVRLRTMHERLIADRAQRRAFR